MKGSEELGSLEALTEKIIEDGQNQAQKLIEKAVENSKKELEEEIREIERICENRIKEAEVKAAELYHRICAEKEIEIRDKNLLIKQNVMDRVFHEALMQLKNLDIMEYKELLTRMLLDKDLSNDILILPEKYHRPEYDMDSFLNGLVGKDKVPLKTVYQPLAGGFILMRDGIEENYTFEAWIDVIRQEMEREVVDILYGEET